MIVWFVRLVKCVFCKGDHYSDKCNVVTDMKARAGVIKKDRLCYINHIMELKIVVQE